MKKFLLIAVAALMTGSAIAQSVKTAKALSTKSVNKSEMRSIVGKTVKPFEGKMVNRPMKGQKFVQLSQKEASSLKATHVISAQAPRKVGALQASYNGRGQNYSTKEDASWTMISGTAEDGTPLLAEVIPLPEAWASLESIAVEYKLVGNTITIEPQKVASSDTHFFYLHSWASESGAIELTLNEDGTLTTIEGEDIAYSAFTEDRFDLSKDGPYAGLALDIENVKYYVEGQVVVPTAGYEPEGLFLHVSPNVNGNYYTNLMMPAYGDITLTNRTDGDADTYNWSLQPVKYNSTLQENEPVGDPITATTKNFTFNTGNSNYNPAQLVASFNGASSEVFTWNRATWYAGGMADNWDDGTTPTMTFTKANPSGELTYLNAAGVRSVILYQGKPARPLYFTGINTMIYQFAQTEAKEPVNLTCKIYKAHRDASGRFSMGELVAQSDLNTDLIETGDWLATRLNWTNFYVEDEFGLTEDLEYIFMEDEFAVVLEGWDNGTFSGYPLAFASPNKKGVSSTFAITPTQEEYAGSGWSFTGNVILGFIDAAYGYLHTTDNTDLALPADGGEATIHIKPMLNSIDNETEQPTYRLFTKDIIVDGEEAEEFPEWLTINIANEDYNEDSEHYAEYDLIVKAEALPAEVKGRKAEITFFQEGALLKVSVLQGEDASGISQTKVATSVSNGKLYDLNGRQVKAGKKGLILSNGKKFIVK